MRKCKARDPPPSPEGVVTRLEECLVVPVWVDMAQLGGDPVVLPHEERVDHGQHRLLVHPPHNNILYIFSTIYLKYE